MQVWCTTVLWACGMQAEYVCICFTRDQVLISALAMQALSYKCMESDSHSSICHWIWENPPSMHTTASSSSNDSCTTIRACIGTWRLPRLLLLWLVSEACQTSMSAQVAFKWSPLHLTSTQPAVICHTTGWWVSPWI